MSKCRVIGLVPAAFLLAASAASAAQTTTRAPRLYAIPTGELSEFFGPYQLDAMTAEWRESTAPHRVRRAERAAAMINAGDCAGARALVAHDRLMAYRVSQVCAQYEVSDPVSVASEEQVSAPQRATGD